MHDIVNVHCIIHVVFIVVFIVVMVLYTIPVQAHLRLSGPMKRVACTFAVPEVVQKLMTAPLDIVNFTFYDPVDMVVRLVALSPIGARPENLALFPEESKVLHDYCHGARLRRMHDSMPEGAAVLTAVIFFDEINRDAKGFASGDGAIVVAGNFRQRVRESTYAKASIGTFPQMDFPKAIVHPHDVVQNVH
jgi:hypothetical protein